MSREHYFKVTVVGTLCESDVAAILRTCEKKDMYFVKSPDDYALFWGTKIDLAGAVEHVLSKGDMESGEEQKHTIRVGSSVDDECLLFFDQSDSLLAVNLCPMNPVPPEHVGMYANLLLDLVDDFKVVDFSYRQE